MTGQGDAGEPVDLDRYRKTGHLVLEGRLGDDPVIVVMTPYWFKRIASNRQLLGGPEWCRREAAALQGWDAV
ncbi:MAG: hypothetical protein HYU41_04175 [Candidatus Rokubacteria bacterium]|nr:hypothetical protein [Candidatus Rokubacteria bacterium]